MQNQIICIPLHPQSRNNGAIAQLVEQRTENPCVPGSIPGGTTEILIPFWSQDFLFYAKKQKANIKDQQDQRKNLRDSQITHKFSIV